MNSVVLTLQLVVYIIMLFVITSLEPTDDAVVIGNVDPSPAETQAVVLNAVLALMGLLCGLWDLAYNSGSAPYAASVALLPFPGTQDLKQGLELLQKTSKKPGT